jgi:hypothetical protein
MRVVALILVSIAALGGAVALAQSESTRRERASDSTPQEAPEEVIVRGRRLAELKLEMEVARERAYGLFNDLNDDDDFDVYCRDEGRTGTRSKQRVCRAQFEDRISASASKGYLSGLMLSCPGGQGVTQDCVFSDDAQDGISRAQGVENSALSRRDELNQKILHLARNDNAFAQAIVAWYDANRKYDEARKRRDE